MKHFIIKNYSKKEIFILSSFQKMLKKSKNNCKQFQTSFARTHLFCKHCGSDSKFIISGSGDPFDDDSENTIRIWNLLEKRQEAVLEGHTSAVQTVAVISDNKYIISGSRDKTIRIWNLLEKRQEAVLQGHLERVNSVVVTSDSKYIISGSNDMTIRIWNLLEKKTRSCFARTFFSCKQCSSDKRQQIYCFWLSRCDNKNMEF